MRAASCSVWSSRLPRPTRCAGCTEHTGSAGSARGSRSPGTPRTGRTLTWAQGKRLYQHRRTRSKRIRLYRTLSGRALNSLPLSERTLSKRALRRSTLHGRVLCQWTLSDRALHHGRLQSRVLHVIGRAGGGWDENIWRRRARSSGLWTIMAHAPLHISRSELANEGRKAFLRSAGICGARNRYSRRISPRGSELSRSRAVADGTKKASFLLGGREIRRRRIPRLNRRGARAMRNDALLTVWGLVVRSVLCRPQPRKCTSLLLWAAFLHHDANLRYTISSRMAAILMGMAAGEPPLDAGKPRKDSRLSATSRFVGRKDWPRRRQVTLVSVGTRNRRAWCVLRVGARTRVVRNCLSDLRRRHVRIGLPGRTRRTVFCLICLSRWRHACFLIKSIVWLLGGGVAGIGAVAIGLVERLGEMRLLEIPTALLRREPVHHHVRRHHRRPAAHACRRLWTRRTRGPLRGEPTGELGPRDALWAGRGLLLLVGHRSLRWPVNILDRHSGRRRPSHELMLGALGARTAHHLILVWMPACWRRGLRVVWWCAIQLLRMPRLMELALHVS